jgi:hypothetical protein
VVEEDVVAAGDVGGLAVVDGLPVGEEFIRATGIEGGGFGLRDFLN